MNNWKIAFFNSKKHIIYIYENVEDFKIICNVNDDVLLGNMEYTVVKKVTDYINNVIRIYLEVI